MKKSSRMKLVGALAATMMSTSGCWPGADGKNTNPDHVAEPACDPVKGLKEQDFVKTSCPSGSAPTPNPVEVEVQAGGATVTTLDRRDSCEGEPTQFRTTDGVEGSCTNGVRIRFSKPDGTLATVDQVTGATTEVENNVITNRSPEGYTATVSCEDEEVAKKPVCTEVEKECAVSPETIAAEMDATQQATVRCASYGVGLSAQPRVYPYLEDPTTLAALGLEVVCGNDSTVEIFTENGRQTCNHAFLAFVDGPPVPAQNSNPAVDGFIDPTPYIEAVVDANGNPVVDDNGTPVVKVLTTPSYGAVTNPNGSVTYTLPDAAAPTPQGYLRVLCGDGNNPKPVCTQYVP